MGSVEEDCDSPIKRHNPKELTSFVMQNLRDLVAALLIEGDFSMDDICMLVYIQTSKPTEAELLKDENWSEKPILLAALTRLLQQGLVENSDGHLILTALGTERITATQATLEKIFSNGIMILRCIGGRTGDIVRQHATLKALRFEFND